MSEKRPDETQTAFAIRLLREAALEDAAKEVEHFAKNYCGDAPNEVRLLKLAAHRIRQMPT